MAVRERRRPVRRAPTDLELYLVEARELVRRGWTQGAYGRDARPSRWAPTDYTTAARVDAAGAIELVATRRELQTSAVELLRVLVLQEVEPELRRRSGGDTWSLERCNDLDGVTKTTVLRWYDRAIERLRSR